MSDLQKSEGLENMDIAALERSAVVLEQHPDYRVLRRFVPQQGAVPPEGCRVGRGLVLDTETTGMAPDQDKIIEVAILAFEFCLDTGQIFRVVDTYSGLEDPQMPIPPAAAAVNGITDEMVSGQSFDDGRIEEMARGAAIVIAHNAGFDRPFMERRFPVFSALPWACSIKQIDWRQQGLGSAKLEWLAWQAGYFYDAHRAEVDCQVLLDILSRKLPVSGDIALLHLIRELETQDFQLFANGAPYAVKETLKARGYRWDGEEKVWSVVTKGRDAARAESDWLVASVFGGRPVELEFEARDAFTRFSEQKVERRRRRFALPPQLEAVVGDQRLLPSDPSGQ